MSEQRVFYRDIIPYAAPSSLDALRGPARGLLELPKWVFWGPDRTFDLDNGGSAEMAYRAIVTQGTEADQEALLNRALLTRHWADMRLPTRCRILWESRFPELGA